jgi:hypothetical protein
LPARCFPKTWLGKLLPRSQYKLYWRSRSLMRLPFCAIVSRSTPTPVAVIEFIPGVSFYSVVFREPRVCARVETPPSPKEQCERSIVSSVELLPSPPQCNQQRSRMDQKHSRTNQVWLWSWCCEECPEVFQRTPYCSNDSLIYQAL